MPVHKEPSAGTAGTTKSAVLEHTNLCFAVRFAAQAVSRQRANCKGVAKSSAEVMMLL